MLLAEVNTATPNLAACSCYLCMDSNNDPEKFSTGGISFSKLLPMMASVKKIQGK